MDFAAQIAMAAAANPVKIDVPDRVAGRVLHIDGDYAAYYCSGNDETSPGVARRVTVETFEGMATRSGASSIVVHLTTPQSNKGLRYFAATVKPYQAQRKGSAKPKNWQYLRDFLETYDGERFRVVQWSDREADDGMAMCAYYGAANGKPIVIATRDKDMRMLPGIHLEWTTKDIVADVPLHAYDVVGKDDKQYGYKWLLLQALHGDTADHIPGLEKVVVKGQAKQVGEVTASQIIGWGDNDLASGFKLVEAAYASYYKVDWATRLAEQLSLLYLRHDKSAEVHSWTKNSKLREAARPELIAAAEALTVRCLAEEKALAEIKAE